jgi:hypothetical protein
VHHRHIGSADISPINEVIEMESSIQNQPVKRKRGRPPGTKNKPKAPAETKAAAKPETKAVAKPADVSRDVRAINALVEKVDQHEGKIEQYYRSIGQHIAAIKTARPGDWLTVVDTECNLKKTRAYDLLAIASGTKTVEQVRGASALRVRESRKKEIPLRSGQNQRSPAHTVSGNDQDPYSSADAMKEKFAEADAKEAMQEEEVRAESGDPGKYQDALYNKICNLVGRLAEDTRKKLILHLVDTYGRPDDYPELPDSLRRAPKAA